MIRYLLDVFKRFKAPRNRERRPLRTQLPVAAKAPISTQLPMGGDRQVFVFHAGGL